MRPWIVAWPALALLAASQARAAARLGGPIVLEGLPADAAPGALGAQVADWLRSGGETPAFELGGGIATVRLPDFSLKPPAAAPESAPSGAALAPELDPALPGALELRAFLRETPSRPSAEPATLPPSPAESVETEPPGSRVVSRRREVWKAAREAVRGFDPAKFATPEGRDEAARLILGRVMDARLGLSEDAADPPRDAPAEGGARAFGYQDGAWIPLREGPAVQRDAQAWSRGGIARLRLTGLPLVGPEGRFRFLGDPVPGSYKEFAGGAVDLTLAWSAESGKYVILEATAQRGSRTKTFAYQTVSGRSAGGGFALLESFRMSLHGGGRSWAERFPELRIDRVPLGIEGKLSVLGQDGLASFGAAYEGKPATVFLSWSKPEKRYVVTEVRVETEGATRIFPFKTIWGRRGPQEPLELLGSYHHYSRLSRVRAWARDFPELEVRSATLYDNGRLGVLGETDVLVLGRAYEGRSADASLAWSEATRRYVVTEVRVAGGPTLPFRTVWGFHPGKPEPVLLDSYWRRYPGHRFPWRVAEFPRISIRGVELDRTGRFSTLTYNGVARFPAGYAGGTAEVFLARSHGGKGYLITHARGQARGRPPVTLWFTQLASLSERAWPSASVRQSAYQGGRQWWWLGMRSGVKAGDAVWVPWTPVSPGLFHSRANATLYRFEHDPGREPTYGVYRWTVEGPELLGAWAGERWIEAGELARYRARLDAGQQRTFEELFERANGVWARDADLLDAAVEAGATALIQGLDRDQAWNRMKRAAQRERFSRRTALLDDIGYHSDDPERPSYDPEDASRSARPAQNAARKALGRKLSALLTPRELSALAEAYDLDARDYGWDARRLAPVLETERPRLLDEALRKIREAAEAGGLSELDALFN